MSEEPLYDTHHFLSSEIEPRIERVGVTPHGACTQISRTLCFALSLSRALPRTPPPPWLDPPPEPEKPLPVPPLPQMPRSDGESWREEVRD